MGVSQGGRGLASLRTDQVVKGRRVRDTRSEILQVPKVTESLEDGGSGVRGRLAGGRVSTEVLNPALGGVRRNEPSGQTATETVKAEGVDAAVLGGLSVGLVVRADGKRGSDVVEETAGLVEGDQEQGLVPLGSRAEGVVDLL